VEVAVEADLDRADARAGAPGRPSARGAGVSRTSVAERRSAAPAGRAGHRSPAAAELADDVAGVAPGTRRSSSARRSARSSSAAKSGCSSAAPRRARRAAPDHPSPISRAEATKSPAIRRTASRPATVAGRRRCGWRPRSSGSARAACSSRPRRGWRRTRRARPPTTAPPPRGVGVSIQPASRGSA
jgi:hypothetical protein